MEACLLRNWRVLVLFTLVVLSVAPPVFAKPSVIYSADGRYQAIPVLSAGAVHYQVKEKSTGRVVLTTHAQFNEANDVKGGLFSPDSQTFTAAYHYRDKGDQTWVAVWTLASGFLLHAEEKSGFLIEPPGGLPAVSPSVIRSPDGRYEARNVVMGKSLHYQIMETATGRKNLITKAQFNTPNNARVGLFSTDSTEFAVAYHYGHNGNYTWIGIWNVSTGLFRGALSESGFLTKISPSVFSVILPKSRK